MQSPTLPPSEAAKYDALQAEIAYLFPAVIVLGITTLLFLLIILHLLLRSCLPRKRPDIEQTPSPYVPPTSTFERQVLWPETPDSMRSPAPWRLGRISAEGMDEIDLSSERVRSAQAVAIRPVLKEEMSRRSISRARSPARLFTVKTVDVPPVTAKGDDEKMKVGDEKKEKGVSDAKTATTSEVAAANPATATDADAQQPEQERTLA